MAGFFCAAVSGRLSRDDGLQNRFPAVGAVDVAGAQGAAFEVRELVEDEQRVIAHAAEMPVPSRSFLCAVGGTGGGKLQHFYHPPYFPF